MSLSRIVLQMARNPGTEFAEGDDRRGYVIVAPLDADGRLDGEAFSHEHARCVVRHFADGEPATTGHLARRGENWFIDYDPTNEQPDERGFHLGDHHFRIGEYVTFRDAHDHAWTYRVADVKRA
ncbi:hypothetical protein ACO2Q3_25490 [Caulobacter sp. KR2-114]|uniref:hypothetical protein n=1 Tax=Caulobacter sp. KR2-114 TaxID=3400912 RepID=UPI003C11269B